MQIIQGRKELMAQLLEKGIKISLATLIRWEKKGLPVMQKKTNEFCFYNIDDVIDWIIKK